MRATVFALLLLSAVASPFAADDIAVDVELVLAVDVSYSMDYDEQRLQREGYVAAFRHPDIKDAIASGRYKRIAVIYFEWAGIDRQVVRVPWTLIDGPEASEKFAAALEAAPFKGGPRTSISAAMTFAAELFDENGFEGLRRVLDISGDGPNNMGKPVDGARDALVGRGIIINGLPLILRPAYMSGFSDTLELNDYYRDCVIGGVGSFMVTVEKKEEFADAIRKKLIQELAEFPVRLIRVSRPSPAEPADCLIGEKLHQDVP
ncbi:MAG: DUF1194 domain-containing protein [Pseudomonadota bacterium]|nr:DUF1194 domain-containing protein [Pseudomonadota bacterium]